MHDDNDDNDDPSHPTHIPIPPPPSFSSLFNRVDDPSPDPTQFHTAPSSPNSPFPSPSIYFTPPSSPRVEPPSNVNQPYFSTQPLDLPSSIPIAVPHASLNGVDRPLSDFSSDDAFPATIDLALDLGLDDEGLSTLEKIYLFSRSNASFHRVFIVHALPAYLHQVTPQEAIEYVLPLLSGLAMDEDEQVKEALAAELVPVIWWFFTHCQIIADDLGAEDAVYASSSTTVTISVQAFTPILGTLLLSSNPLVGGAARFAVVRLLSRMKKADDKDTPKGDSNGLPSTEVQQPGMRIDFSDDEDEDEDEDAATGLFRRAEREMFQHEILQQVVIGMGKLDVDIMESDYSEGAYYRDSEQSSWRDSERNRNTVIPGSQTASASTSQEQANTIDISRGGNPAINPYFPLLPSTSFDSSAIHADNSTALPPESSVLLPGLPVSVIPAVASTSTISLPAERLSHIPRSVECDDSLRTTLPSSPERLTGSSSSSPSPGATSLPHSDAVSSNTDGSSLRAPTDDWMLHSQRLGRSDLLSPPETQFLEDQHYSNNAYNDNENNDDEQAAVGRLSSMSLMAAVTASGTLGDATKQAFVKEVERVGQDPVYWVRREASFALGALAKVVPQEVVICSLLPLFEALRRDPVWHVRHSVIFALPAILSRLIPDHRRRLALETATTLCCDESATVRSGVLEALGEVIHTFCEDPLGPPDELVRLFLGRKEDRRVRDGSQYLMSFGFGDENDPPMESFYKDPERPLICGFNFPAVTLTLGRERWGELREFYVDIAANRASKVQRTLAASLGELAKIIGREHAERDLVSVWWDSIRHEDEEVRTKAVGCLETFLDCLSKEVGQQIFQGLLTVWNEGIFSGWRERHLITNDLVRLVTPMGQCVSETARGLTMKALEDSVAAVREIAIAVLPPLCTIFARNDDLIEFRDNLQSLARSTNHRRRMTFIAAQQSLVVSDDQNLLSHLDDDLLKSVAILAEDNIDGVRINVARFMGVICGSLLRASCPVPDLIRELVDKLSQDSSGQVRSYIPNLSYLASHPDTLARSTTFSSKRMMKKLARLATFSRPPTSMPSQDTPTPSERPSAMKQGGNQVQTSAHEPMSADDRFDTRVLLVPRSPADDGNAIHGSDRMTHASFPDQLLSTRAALQPGFDDARVCA